MVYMTKERGGSRRKRSTASSSLSPPKTTLYVLRYQILGRTCHANVERNRREQARIDYLFGFVLVSPLHCLSLRDDVFSREIGWTWSFDMFQNPVDVPSSYLYEYFWGHQIELFCLFVISHQVDVSDIWRVVRSFLHIVRSVKGATIPLVYPVALCM